SSSAAPVTATVTEQKTEKVESKTNGKPKEGQVSGDPNEFWKKAKASGVRDADSKPIAQQAIDGRITWDEAIAQLPV
ncbi:MAG: hypothetical protein ABI977_17215, partial [Acidobacteriota bacterium]